VSPSREPVDALAVTDLTASYGAVVALDGVSLSVAPGTVTAVLGPNGAGKSTLVRCVAGLHDHQGTVTLGATRLRRGRPRDRRRAGVVAVTDRRDLVPSLSVERYLRLTLDGAGADRAVETFPVLGELAGRRCGLLSGGEAQMLALGRALGARPRAIVLDEISQGLAPVVVAQLLVAVRAAATAGAAVLLVEQFVHAASEVADQIVLLDHGVPAYIGGVAGAPLESVYLAGADARVG
jgi:branched-chain amino acid transport system ATP-binding protein